MAIDFSKMSKGVISQWFKQFAYTPKEYIDVEAGMRENFEKIETKNNSESRCDRFLNRKYKGNESWPQTQIL